MQSVRVDDVKMLVGLFLVFVDNVFPERNRVDKEVQVFSEFVDFNLVKFKKTVHFGD